MEVGVEIKVGLSGEEERSSRPVEEAATRLPMKTAVSILLTTSIVLKLPQPYETFHRGEDPI